MIKLNIIKLIGEIKDDHKYDDAKISIDALCDYDDSNYISDVISEVSDYNIDIYYADLFEWAKSNFSYIEDANIEYGMTEPDITKQIQAGEYYANTQYMYDNLKDMLLIYCYYVLDNNHIEEITEQDNDNIVDYVNSLDNNDYLPSYDDILEKLDGGRK